MIDTICEPARAPPVARGSIAPERDYLSFSAIRLYQQCPLRYYFRYVASLPEETVSASLLFGSAIHRAIEHHFRRLLEGQAAPSVGELLAEYRAGWTDHAAPIRFGRDEDETSLD